MSAAVETVYLYEARCPVCAAGSGLNEDEYLAYEWAATHNAVHHETDNSEDEKYEQFKDSRGI